MSHVYSHGGPKQDVNLNESILWATTSLWGKHAADFICHLTIWQYGFFFLQFAITGRWCNPFLLTLFLSVFVHTKKHTHFITHAHTNPDCPPLSLLSLLSHIPVDVPDWRKSSVGLGQGHGSDNHILTVAPALSPGLQQHDTQPPSLHILTQACTNKRAQHTAQQKHTLLLRCCYDCHIVYGDGNS